MVISPPNHPFRPTDRLLRQFSGLWIVFFLAIAVRQELHDHRHLVATVLGVLAVAVGVLGLAWPRRIKPVFVAWMAVALPIGWIVSRVTLGVLFYGLFTPVAWTLRLKGRDELGLKQQPEVTSYWHRKPSATDKSQYLRQF